MSRRAIRNDAGFVGGADALLFGVLVFVCGTILVTNLWSVLDSKMTATNAAMEGARAYVEAPDGDTAAVSARDTAFDVLIRSHRDDDAGVTIETTDGFRRCSRVTVTVERDVSLLSIPLLGQLGGSIRIRSSHSELVDPFRSGDALDGDGEACDG